MTRLQQMMQTIGAQLKGLSATSRMLIGSLLIIVLMGLFLVSLYAGKQTMSPLGLTSSVSADARNAVKGELQSRGINFEDKGGDLYVPIEQKYAVLATLSERSLLAPDQINFEKLVADDSPFRSRDQNKQRYLVAKMHVLEGMISSMSGIDRATVVLDQPDRLTGIGSASIQPSAAVSIWTKGDELSQTQVDAIARLVSGAQAGMKVNQVMVVDARTGKAMAARTDDQTSSGAYMDVKRAAEQHAHDTLASAVRYIPGAMIAVNAQVDARQVVQEKHSVDEPKVGPLRENTTSSNSSAPAITSAPGVSANVGTSIQTATAGPSRSEEKSDVSTVPMFPSGTDQIKDTKGYALKINATVGIPKSYFVRLYQDEQGDTSKTPDQATLDSVVQRETSKIKADLEPLIDTKALDGAVGGTLVVSMFPDFELPVAGAGTMPGGTTTTMASAANGGGFMGGMITDRLLTYVTLGGLAAVSLLMMMMMVRKAAVRQELPTAAELVGIPPALAGDGDLVGEADEAAPALEGLELTDEVLRRQQMLEQINEMIESSPGEAAGLVRKWIRTAN
ncbi:MAG TPA: hypothetical protein VG711_02030 [Phycisphaerales bacterium]|nr:hypothetical protein [Phycisphaerales bacterium]